MPVGKRISPADAAAGVVVLHIAMFSDTYFPYISGVVRSIERLSEALRARGHQVTVFGPRYWGHHDDVNAGIRRCPSLPLYPPGNLVLAMPHIGSTVRAMKAMGVDVIHSHSPFIMGMTAVHAARQMQVPVVFSHHSVYHEYAVYAPKALRRPTEKLILEWINWYVHSVDAVVAPSGGTRDFIRVTYGVDATVISNPIAAPNTLKPQNRSADAARPVLLFVGRLGKEKNLPLLLRAFAQVRAEAPAHLVLVGDGPERGNLERLAAELGVLESITITGFLSYSGVSEWYSQAQLFVFPSRNETQGMVMLEALAHGVPVVAVESEASHAVLDLCHAGRIVTDQPAAMAEAIRELISQPQNLAGLGEEGAKHAQRYTAAGVAEQMEQLYAGTRAGARKVAAGAGMHGQAR